MKKFRWFTLLESLAVIGIIWIISTAFYNMRNIWKDYTNYQKEAVSTIHKEIEHALKEFQRAKVWTDRYWNAHEISSFQIKLTDWKWRFTGNYLEIWNTYLFCIDINGKTTPCFKGNTANPDAIWTWFFEWNKLINNNKYTAPKKIKEINKLKFLIETENLVDSINILPNWDIKEWDYIKNYAETINNLTNYRPADFPVRWDSNNVENNCNAIFSWCINHINTENTTNQWVWDNILNRITWGWRENIQCCSRWVNCQSDQRYQENCAGNSAAMAKYVQLNACLEHNNFSTHNCEQYTSEQLENTTITNEEEENSNLFSFIVYSNKDNEKCTNKEWTLWTPIWKITINTITKTSSLQRCDTEVRCDYNICISSIELDDRTHVTKP